MKKTKPTRIFFVIILLLAVAAYIFQHFFENPGGSNVCSFDKRVPSQELRYVEHAKCRMQCRDVDRELVEEVYEEGALNCGKSDPAGKRNGHPRYALEMADGRRGRVRLIIEENAGEHIVITVIRLDEEDHCDCS